MCKKFNDSSFGWTATNALTYFSSCNTQYSLVLINGIESHMFVFHYPFLPFLGIALVVIFWVLINGILSVTLLIVHYPFFLALSRYSIMYADGDTGVVPRSNMFPMVHRKVHYVKFTYNHTRASSSDRFCQ